MSQTREDHLNRARSAKRESKYLDFKESFDPSSEGEWCELAKDIVAMANSGGGVLVIGVKNNGMPSGESIQPVLDLDLATIGDKIYKYTDQHFTAVHIDRIKRGSHHAATMVIDGRPVPLIFTSPGNYEVVNSKTGKRKSKSAFQRGVIYVRHGAKSEPATSEDLVDIIDRRVDELRDQWLGGIRQVIEAPADTNIAVYRPTETDEVGRPTRVRLTTEPGAPTYRMADPNELHPYRQTELIKVLNARLPVELNPHDMLAVRRVHNIDEKTRPEFAYKPRFGSLQYSDAYVDWLVTQYERDKRFFERVRTVYHDQAYG